MGWFLVACGMVFLMLAVSSTLFSLSSVRFGPIQINDLSQFSALNTFIGIVLIAMGVIVNTGRRPF
jgi:formate hydrogenlyase subunit 3/multisubunit Na+/H+ antiporter MnhD subunit